MIWRSQYSPTNISDQDIDVRPPTGGSAQRPEYPHNHVGVWPPSHISAQLHIILHIQSKFLLSSYHPTSRSPVYPNRNTPQPTSFPIRNYQQNKHCQLWRGGVIRRAGWWSPSRIMDDPGMHQVCAWINNDCPLTIHGYPWTTNVYPQVIPGYPLTTHDIHE